MLIIIVDNVSQAYHHLTKNVPSASNKTGVYSNGGFHSRKYSNCSQASIHSLLQYSTAMLYCQSCTFVHVITMH